MNKFFCSINAFSHFKKTLGEDSVKTIFNVINEEGRVIVKHQVIPYFVNSNEIREIIVKPIKEGVNK